MVKFAEVYKKLSFTSNHGIKNKKIEKNTQKTQPKLSILNDTEMLTCSTVRPLLFATVCLFFGKAVG